MNWWQGKGNIISCGKNQTESLKKQRGNLQLRDKQILCISEIIKGIEEEIGEKTNIDIQHQDAILWIVGVVKIRCSKIRELETELNILVSQLKLNKEQREREKELDSLLFNEELEKIKKQLHRFQSDSESSMKEKLWERQERERTVNEKEKEISQLTTTVINLRGELDSMTNLKDQEKAMFHERKIQFEQEYNKLIEKYKEDHEISEYKWKQMIQDMENKMKQSLNKEISNRDKQISLFKQNLEELKEVHSNLSISKSQIEQQSNSHSNTIISLTQQLNESKKLASHQLEINQIKENSILSLQTLLGKQKKELGDQIGSLQAKLEESKQQQLVLTNEYSNSKDILQRQFNQTQKDSQYQSQNQQQQNQKLQANVKQLEEQIHQIQEEKSKLLHQIKQLNIDYENKLKSDDNQHKLQVITLNNQIEQIKLLSEQKQQQIIKEQQELNTLNTQQLEDAHKAQIKSIEQISDQKQKDIILSMKNQKNSMEQIIKEQEALKEERIHKLEQEMEQMKLQNDVASKIQLEEINKLHQTDLQLIQLNNSNSTKQEMSSVLNNHLIQVRIQSNLIKCYFIIINYQSKIKEGEHSKQIQLIKEESEKRFNSLRQQFEYKESQLQDTITKQIEQFKSLLQTLTIKENKAKEKVVGLEKNLQIEQNKVKQQEEIITKQKKSIEDQEEIIFQINLEKNEEQSQLLNSFNSKLEEQKAQAHEELHKELISQEELLSKIRIKQQQIQDLHDQKIATLQKDIQELIDLIESRPSRKQDILHIHSLQQLIQQLQQETLQYKKQSEMAQYNEQNLKLQVSNIKEVFSIFGPNNSSKNAIETQEQKQLLKSQTSFLPIKASPPLVSNYLDQFHFLDSTNNSVFNTTKLSSSIIPNTKEITPFLSEIKQLSHIKSEQINNNQNQLQCQPFFHVNNCPTEFIDKQIFSLPDEKRKKRVSRSLSGYDLKNINISEQRNGKESQIFTNNNNNITNKHLDGVKDSSPPPLPNQRLSSLKLKKESQFILKAMTQRQPIIHSTQQNKLTSKKIPESTLAQAQIAIRGNLRINESLIKFRLSARDNLQRNNINEKSINKSKIFNNNNF